MALSSALSKHGTFIYGVDATIRKHGSSAHVARAIRECDMQHVWIRIHGKDYIETGTFIKELIQACKDEGLSVAGWGWCQGESPKAEAERAKKALSTLGLKDYIADIEEGVSNSKWTQQEVATFFDVLRSAANGPESVGLSSHGFIDWHSPELLEPAIPYVDLMCPQTYWFRYPSKKMLRAVGESQVDFPLDDPGSYLRLCVKRWSERYGKPVLATAQAYTSTDESPSFTQSIADQKVESFLESFKGWKDLAGLNWWYFPSSSSGSMSNRMYQAIRSGRLNEKF